MGDHEAVTIHSLLGLRPVEDCDKGRRVLRKKGPSKVQPGSVVIVDEASMIQRELLQEIRKATSQCKVLYVGDAYQLPPVRAKESPVFKMVKSQSHLTHVHRQALDNPIISVATQFREALDGAPFPKLETVEPGVIRLDRTTFERKMLETFSAGESCRVLAWTNTAVRGYNTLIRNHLLDSPSTPITVGEQAIVNTAITNDRGIVFGTDTLIRAIQMVKFSIGDVEGYKVLVTNDEKTQWVFIPKDWEDAKAVLKQFMKKANALESEKRKLLKAKSKIPMRLESDRRARWREYFDAQRLFADVRPPHASTVHKSQGSTYQTVFVDLDDLGRNTKWYETARLLYVAFTRAAETVYITGELPSRLYERETS